MEVYRNPGENATEDFPQRYGFRRSALEVKAAVPLSRYCRDWGIELKPSGIRLVGLCPFHDEKTPSFTVYADSSYFCFGYQRHGDVIDLHAHLDSHPAKWTALVDLARHYSVRLPERPKKWHGWQDAKIEIRNLAKNHLAKVYQRRLTRVYAPLLLLGGETPEEELALLEELAQALWPKCRELAGRRIVGE